MSRSSHTKAAHAALRKAWSDLRDAWDAGKAARVPVDAKGMRALLCAIERLEGSMRRLQEGNR